MKNFYFALLLLILTACGQQNTTSVGFYAPTGLVAVLLSETQVQLSWSDNSTNENGFLIQRAEGEGEFITIHTSGPDVADYLDDDVEESVTYLYRVAAVFNDDQSDWSNTVQIFTQSVFSLMEFGDEAGFDIMTWNLEHYAKNGQVTVSYVTQVLEMLQIDLIALQEIESVYYFQLLDGNLTNWSGYLASGSSYDLNLAYLYRDDTILNVNIYEIYEDLWYPFPRAPLVMEFTYNGNELVTINNHFKAGGDPEDEERRQQACQYLEQYIETNFDSDNVIVLGDLNDDITEPEESNVFWNFIEDEDDYRFADMEIALGDPAFWSYPSWPSHLDHIMITGELFDEFQNLLTRVETIQVDNHMDGGWGEYDSNISDHLPVALKLIIE